MNDRDYWKICHICQGNGLLAVKPPSAIRRNVRGRLKEIVFS